MREARRREIVLGGRKDLNHPHTDVMWDSGLMGHPDNFSSLFLFLVVTTTMIKKKSA
jgi:hypothetical protein